MKLHGTAPLFSASDIGDFLACRPLTALNCVGLKTGIPHAEEDPTAKLLKDKGYAHESRFLEKLRSQNLKIVEIPKTGPLKDRARLTREALQSGADVVFQAAFLQEPWLGFADFLIKNKTQTKLGAFGYEVYDTKLARQAEPRFLVQLALYAELLSGIQGSPGEKVHVVLGDDTTQSFQLTAIAGYLWLAKERFLKAYEAVHKLSSLEEAWNQPNLPYPIPCERCSMCPWLEVCEAKRLKDDHPCQVANIRKAQYGKLEAAGIKTMAALAQLHGKAAAKVPGMPLASVRKLAHQAALQQKEKTTGEQCFDLLSPFDKPEPSAQEAGFNLFPEPSPGDLFFDMEGDPLEDGGLEYLFGVAFSDKGKPEFKAFWAHTREDEKKAFEAFIDFALARLKAFPEAHIYHYAPYEVTAMRRLAGRHATREKEVDDLLRNNRFVDLYRVVREALVISKDSYSIKKVEAFYRSKREGGVKKADESIVVYEEWKVSKDGKLLKSIEDYNKDDCVSTLQLRDWLLKISPAWIPAKTKVSELPLAEQEAPKARSQKALDEEAERAEMEAKLEPYARGEGHSRLAKPPVFSLLAQLLGFHVREKKPMWWSLFDRQGAELQDLLDDEEVIAGCEVEGANEAGSSTKVRFKFPEQDFKVREGDNIKSLGTLRSGKVTAVDEKSRIATVDFRGKVELGKIEHLAQCADVPTGGLAKAILRFAHSLTQGKQSYKALLDYLNRRQPDIEGAAQGKDLLNGKPASVENIWEAVRKMKGTTLYIQGPPGSGKTYTGARLIAKLVKEGKKVAVCSNSHKAVNHLMGAAHAQLLKEKHPHQAMKKANSEEQASDKPGIQNVDDDKKIIRAIETLDLVGGVAWTFCKPELDQRFDFLFVDEAGQVSLANLIAMGVCAKNIVLLGDQMQLGQPIQAAHPGRSGESALDYLLDGKATIRPEQGIFLDKTFRMQPELCGFVSDCFYEGRLHPDARTNKQKLVLPKGYKGPLKQTGLLLHAVPHKDCSQRSSEEAAVVEDLIEGLLTLRCVDHEGKERAMTLEDILVVAPYNAQVGLLTRTLPKGSRVGTVDKFQGQEAEVVIVSMTSSTADESPRGMGFLLDRNRINVAVSRGRCLSIIVCSPTLLESTARSVEDVFRLNVLGVAEERTGLTKEIPAEN